MDAKILRETTSSLSLLYVEDDDILRSATTKLFEHLFKTVQTAENGLVALDKMNNAHFDLIVTDINMPLMNGIQFVKNVREDDKNKTIIVTSAHDESHYLLELIELGIDKFLLKPLNMQKLISVLSQVCTHIMNEKLIISYKKEIESANLQLKTSNQRLEVLVKQQDSKIEPIKQPHIANADLSDDYA